MGSRGPLPQPVARRRSRTAEVASAPPVELVAAVEPPPVPVGLGDAGLAAWRAAWGDSPWLAETDAAMVEAVARLEDEAAMWRACLAEAGPLLVEPLQNSKGDVIGERRVVNPAAAELRRVERSIREHRAVLGLTPASRARLGLDVARLRAAQLEERDRRRAAIVGGYRQAATRKPGPAK